MGPETPTGKNHWTKVVNCGVIPPAPTLTCGTHSGRLQAAVGLHFLFDDLLLLPEITELSWQQLPMAFDPRKSDNTSTKQRRNWKMTEWHHHFLTIVSVLSRQLVSKIVIFFQYEKNLKLCNTTCCEYWHHNTNKSNSPQPDDESSVG